MENSPPDAFCNLPHDAGGRDKVPRNRCGERISLDSSRSTRGGSEVPNFKISFLNKQEGLPMSDSKKAIKAVGSKFKAVFAKGRENKGLGIKKPVS